jgi:phosphohistidine swiveling domain-containing protein
VLLRSNGVQFAPDAKAFIERMKARGKQLASLDFASMSTLELARSFPKVLQENLGDWDLQYLFIRAGVLLVFQKASRDWLDDPDLSLAYRLFAGLGGIPEAEAGLALWRLAQQAHANQQTEAVLTSGTSWSDTLAKLRQFDRGGQFLAAWDAFMAEHGHHCRGELELFNARWSERPDYILGLVRSYLCSIDQANPVAKQQRLARERQQLTEQCRRRLKNPLQRAIFSWSLRRVQQLSIDREDWKDCVVRHIAVLRRMLLLLGERLEQQGKLIRRDDIFFLEVSEIEPFGTSPDGFDFQQLIATRRAEYEKNRLWTPPPVVVGRYDPNSPGAPLLGANATVLTGIPVFPGTITGRAKVILRTDDHQSVFPGEILVAPFTDPAWTPYFVTAAGVVMDQGGILSHGSIVAREYGLPSVTNVGSATRLISTGDLVQVDGTRGQVTVLERA